METVAVSGVIRSSFGKSASKADRREKLIPCVMYGGDEPIHFTTTLNEVKNVVYTPDFKLVQLEIDGVSYKCILKDWQADPVTDEIRHIDFLKLVDGRKVKLEIPLKFVGTSPGVKVGGKLLQKVRRIKVKTIPEKIIDSLELDISALELGQSIRVRDIAAIEGVEIMNSPGIPVATIEIPRALRAAEAAKAKE